MKRLTLTFITLLTCIGMRAQVSFGETELFNGGWLFSLSDDAKASETAFDDTGWRQLDVPHDWSIEGQLSQDYASCTGYLPAGIGWYRKHFTHVGTQPKTYIYFEGIYNRSEVYLNGHLLGKRPNGYVSFLYDMTPWLKQGENVLAVRVDHSRIADSRWYTGSGIYRDVWLVQAPEVHLSQWGATYRLKKLEDGVATIEVDVAVDAPKGSTAPYEACVSIYDKGRQQTATSFSFGKLKAGQTKRTVELRLPQARLWGLKSPFLYQLRIDLMTKLTVVDHTTIAMGLRTLQFDPDKGFALNGEWMKVKGVCLHHDAGVLGAAVPREVWLRKVRELKRMGANAIRMSHNPQAPILYDICDQEGMLVMDEGSDEWEFPKRKWIKGWNQGEPGFDGTYDFFEEWIDRDVADMVMRDRNHPCVFLWSVGNEVDYPNDPYSHPVLDGNNATISQPMFGGYKPDAPHAERIGTIAKRIAGVIRSIDTSRPVTGALAGVVMSNETDYPEAIDVVGYNYTEKRYDEDHQTYPRRILYGSETGVGYDSWKAVRDKQHIFGQFIWTGTDYLGESGRWPSRGLHTGLLDFGSFKKPRGWFRAALWSEKPVTYIGTYPLLPPRGDGPWRRWDPARIISPEAQDDWNLPASIPQDTTVMMRVVCYTNAPQARLLLNGRIVGDMQEQNDSNAIIYWDIPFEAGTLRAEGCDRNGKVLSSYDITTNTQPVALRASELLPDDCATLHQLLVEVVDEAGNRVKSALNDVTCTIDGPAVLLGLEGSNNTDMSDYRDNHQPVYRGRLVAYIRRTAPGPVRITFTSEGLRSYTIFALQSSDVPLDSIRMSDPAILADQKTQMYYMTGTGGMMWRSPDLKLWEGPYMVTQFDKDSWMGPRPMIWAAELHQTGDDKYYYFATFTNRDVKIDSVRGNVIERRACQVLRADNPMGPYRAFGDSIYLPANRPTLDGTFWRDKDGKPYMVFCGEWLQNWNGTIEKIELKPDLSGTIGSPTVLFRAGDSPWSREKDENGNVTWNKVTDGPWLFRTGTGRLGMLWTSWVYDVYTQGVAYSESGTLDGPWIQEPEPVTPPNYGHSMLFQRFDGQWMMSVHSHVKDAKGRTIRRPHFFEVEISGDKLILRDK